MPMLNIAALISENNENTVLELICLLVPPSNKYAMKHPWHRDINSITAYFRVAEEYMERLIDWDYDLETSLKIKITTRYLKNAFVGRRQLSKTVRTLPRIYLASLYLASENHDKCLHYLNFYSKYLPRIYAPQTKLTTSSALNTRLLLFLPDVSNAVGLLCLLEGASKICHSEKTHLTRFDVTRYIFKLYLIFLCLLETCGRDFIIPVMLRFKLNIQTCHRLDICLYALVLHRCKKRTSNKMVVKRNSTLNERFTNDLSISTGDTLCEMLLKYGVEYMTKFHEIMQSTIPREFCHITSHYKALYFYKEKDYLRTLSQCDEILQHERCAIPAEYSVHVTMLYPFHTLFDSDVIVLTGLLILCDTHGRNISSLYVVFDFYQNYINYKKRSFRPEFLVLYLRLLLSFI